jgi:Na+/H+-dicarboxylate symporter
MRSHIWMTVGLGAGVSLGLATSLTQWPVLVALVGWLRPFGTLFLNLLSMVGIPLVATALFVGVAGLGDSAR